MARGERAEPIDLFIIGGGINGCGIARDAVGRGLSVMLCEQSDLGQATSSASTKLFHGGLRYLEFYEFRLVREALIERETLLRAMPHISWPMRFVLPHHAGLRPAWLLRLGLFLYDHLGGRKILPATRTLDLSKDPTGAPLKSIYRKGFEYSDCWVNDARLVVLNARDAADRGAVVKTRTRVEAAEREDGLWRISMRGLDEESEATVYARGLVNAGGPWVEEILRQRLRRNAGAQIRLVRGSHIVTRRLFDHDRAYIFQNADGRVFFAIPYEGDFTLIGTTDADHEGAPGAAVCTPEEAEYLCKAASEYFETPVSTDDIVWTFSGVRPLYDDGASTATAATRDYVLEVEAEDGGAPLLSVFGGKITTYRRLAEAALAKLDGYFPGLKPNWTAGVALPGGDFPYDGVGALVARLIAAYPFLDDAWARRLVHAYGTDAEAMLGEARTVADLGESFGATLTEREVAWLVDREWARTIDDVLWRRSKLGLRIDDEGRQALERWLEHKDTSAQAASG